MWRDDPATSIIIGWSQLSGTDAVLYYDQTDHGTEVSSYAFQQGPDRKHWAKGMHNHFARLANLLPNTTYYFIIADSEGLSRRMSFRTMPDHDGERLSVIAGGDSRNHRQARRQANKLVAKLRPHFVLFGGDMTGGDNASQWKGWFDDWQHTIGSDGRLTPIVVTRGNHEYSNKTLVDLFDVKHSSLYYGLSFGGDLLRIYTLNSLIASGGNQRDWLEQDLREHSHMRWKMAQYHFAIRPHVRKKKERNNQYIHWGSLFYQHQMNLVVESDAHCVKTTWPVRPSKERGSDEGYIRDDARGTVFVGEGCWGAPLRRNDDNKSWTRNSGSFNQFKWIFIDYDKIEVRTVMTDNADFVQQVDPCNVFVPPAGLSIWQPSKGPVLLIRPMQAPPVEQPLLVHHKLQKGKYTANSNKVSRKMKLLNFVAQPEEEQFALCWKSSNEPSHRTTYEVQRSGDGKTFNTIAKIEGQGAGLNDYKIVDAYRTEEFPQEIFYRLVHNGAKGGSHFYTIKAIRPLHHQWNDYTLISTNPQTGILKIKYSLDRQGDVRFNLIDQLKRPVAESHHINQNAGNFLKSIDMRDKPKGMYLLTIKSNDTVIKRLKVQHGV